MSTEEFGATVEAYMYPDEFKKCNGESELAKGVSIGQQKRSMFGMAYTTRLGNDTDGSDHGYKIHLIYGAMASPSEKGYETINDSPDAITFSWEISTTPVEVTTGSFKKLEDILYGTDGGTETAKEPRLPLPDELATIFTAG